jgi:hypothetical protein
MIGLAASPGTAVDPTCSTPSTSQGASTAVSRSFSAAANAMSRGSCARISGFA